MGAHQRMRATIREGRNTQQNGRMLGMQRSTKVGIKIGMCEPFVEEKKLDCQTQLFFRVGGAQNSRSSSMQRYFFQGVWADSGQPLSCLR